MVKNGWLEQPLTVHKLDNQEVYARHKKRVPHLVMKPLEEKDKDGQDE